MHAWVITLPSAKIMKLDSILTSLWYFSEGGRGGVRAMEMWKGWNAEKGRREGG